LHYFVKYSIFSQLFLTLLLEISNRPGVPWNQSSLSGNGHGSAVNITLAMALYFLSREVPASWDLQVIKRFLRDKTMMDNITNALQKRPQRLCLVLLPCNA
jgi:hypothetical protein